MMKMPIEVSDYLATLARIEQASEPTSLEPLFRQAEAAQTVLMGVKEGKALLEEFSGAEFVALKAAARGLVISRGVEIYAQPEPRFFLALAKAHGLPQDIAFFERYAQSWGDDLVPTYLKLRPQPTPCVRFGEGKIAPLYRAWLDYAAQYPAAYTALVQQSLADLEETIVLGTCACDGVASVQQEQQDFLKLFPATPRASAIAARQAQLTSDPDVLPVNCR